MPKLAIAAASGLLAFLAITWFVPTFMGIRGAERWILRGLLALIGVIGAAAIVWLTKKPGEQKAEPAAAEAGGESTEVEQLVQEASLKLAKAGLGKIGTLPVVLFLGESGSAKTSILASAGLNTELLAGRAFRDNAVTPTGTANLWILGRVVVADIAGGVLHDPPKWSTLLRRLRPSRFGATVGTKSDAPRLAVVCVSAGSLVAPGAQDAMLGLARNLRRRLGEIAQLNGSQLPTYVLFTHSDRIPFFSDYVKNLSNAEAAQVLGATFAVTREHASEQAGVRETAAFDALYRSLCDFRPAFLAREHDPAILPGIYEFPRELKKMRGLIGDFLTELCKPSQLAVGPFLRGFYFSGVRPVVLEEAAPAPAILQQQSRPQFDAAEATSIFRTGGGLTSSYSPSAAAPAASARRVPQWVFVNQLFDKVILGDKAAMGEAATSVKTSLLRRVLLGSAAAISLLLVITSVVSYGNNLNLQSKLKEYGSLTGAPAGSVALPSVLELTRLESLRQSVAQLATYRKDGAPLSLRWGLYSGEELYEPAQKLYWTNFKALLLAHSQGGLLDDLRRLPPTPGPDYGSTYSKLKAYLITTSNADKSTVQFLSPVLLNRWKEGRQATQEQSQLAQKQFDFYSEQLLVGNPYSVNADSGGVEKARAYLNQFGEFRRIYQAMLTDAAKAGSPVNFNRMVENSLPYVVAPYEVPASFTKAGWDAMKQALQDPGRYYKGEQWVLGNRGGGEIDRTQLEKQVQDWYREDLVGHWRNYVKSASVVKYADLRNASEKLTVLSGNQSPLLALFWLAARNTPADLLSAAAVLQPIYAVVPPASADRYIAPTNQKYVDSLAALQSSVEAAAGQQPLTDTGATGVQTSANAALDARRQIAINFSIGADPIIDKSTRRLLEEPILFVREMIVSRGPAELNAAGKGFCATQFRSLWAKYPFNPNATVQATMPEVNAVLRKPDGALWAFYTQHLQKHLAVKDGSYQQSSESTIKITPAFLRFFNDAAAVSSAFYAGDTQEPHLTFTLKPLPTEGLQQTLRVDGQTVTSQGNATPTQLKWEGSTAREANGSVRFGDSGEMVWSPNEGKWALFRFFGEADSSQSSGRTQIFNWLIRTGKEGRAMQLPNGKPAIVRFELDAGGAFPLFRKEALSKIPCVSEVARVE
ncbi:MAG: hypothetical protein H7039_07390 [Bryobacteraceae bacterium]|nr:hypothetical protein [Bryobacteraceae bacterium]